jgi:hypothetical protein
VHPIAAAAEAAAHREHKQRAEDEMRARLPDLVGKFFTYSVPIHGGGEPTYGAQDVSRTTFLAIESVEADYLVGWMFKYADESAQPREQGDGTVPRSFGLRIDRTIPLTPSPQWTEITREQFCAAIDTLSQLVTLRLTP